MKRIFAAAWLAFATVAMAQQTGPVPAPNLGGLRVFSGEGVPVKATYFGYPMESLESLELYDTVDGANLNTNLWSTSTSTMTVTQSSSFISVNAAATTTAGTYAILSSIPTFWDTSCVPLHFHFTMQATQWTLDANETIEFGWGTVATTAAPTDGVFVRVTNGTWSFVANNGGVETVTTLPIANLPANNATSDFTLDIYGNLARLTKDAMLIDNSKPMKWEIDMSQTQGALVSQSRQSFFVRVYNGGSATATASTVKLGQISVQQRNAQFNKPFSYKMVGMGRSAVQSVSSTFSQLASWANSTEPVSATLSNTTAGYTTPGGQYAFAAPAGAATDFLLFAYQVPAGYQFYVTDVAINSMNGATTSVVGATVATTPTILQWGIGVNSSAQSLATADGAGTWQYRRMAICTQAFQVGALVGATANDCVRTFTAPLVVDGGRWIGIIVRVPVGTATASQIIRGTVSINGYFE